MTDRLEIRCESHTVYINNYKQTLPRAELLQLVKGYRNEKTLYLADCLFEDLQKVDELIDMFPHLTALHTRSVNVTTPKEAQGKNTRPLVEVYLRELLAKIKEVFG
ncbi:hypothetical protein SCP_0805550 [Sparassis crispa]|uniref:Uncharacterized protein n=1 Tax=Sparassis crispa TaxID=139825 RepID=A0A401GUX0_9APHY|nr:hypothetical protein SCP_0805550 [Sparassis crispa]GBE86031.1 hypothetical protein SCP_0805550 [Sparassis crispa]